MDYDDVRNAELGLEPEDVYNDNEDDDVLRRYSRKVDNDEDEDEPEEEVEEEDDDDNEDDEEESESEEESNEEDDKKDKDRDRGKPTKTKTKTKPKRKAKEIDDTPEEVPTLSLAPTTQQKIIFMIVGAIAAGLGILISHLVTKNKNRDQNTDRFLYFCMMLLHQMNRERGFSHQHCPIHQFQDKDNGNGNDDNEKEPYHTYSASSSRVPSTKEYLEHVAKHGAQRIESKDLRPEQRTYKLPSIRKHEHWKVEKDLKDEVTDCYKTHEYLK